MTDNEIIKAFDILDKFEFFGGQRAGRELWFDKPVDVQNADIENFSSDVKFLKDLINRQQKQIDELVERHLNHEESVKKAKEACYQCQERHKEELKTAKSETRKEFAERLKKIYRTHEGLEYTIDNLLKEMG